MYAIEWAPKTLGLLQPTQSSINNKAKTPVIPRPKDAVASLIKRLAHRNANVQLYTLEVRVEYWNSMTRALMVGI